jgi:hypothetical protein
MGAGTETKIAWLTLGSGGISTDMAEPSSLATVGGEMKSGLKTRNLSRISSSDKLVLANLLSSERKSVVR